MTAPPPDVELVGLFYGKTVAALRPWRKTSQNKRHGCFTVPCWDDWL